MFTKIRIKHFDPAAHLEFSRFFRIASKTWRQLCRQYNRLTKVPGGNMILVFEVDIFLNLFIRLFFLIFFIASNFIVVALFDCPLYLLQSGQDRCRPHLPIIDRRSSFEGTCCIFIHCFYLETLCCLYNWKKTQHSHFFDWSLLTWMWRKKNTLKQVCVAIFK